MKKVFFVTSTIGYVVPAAYMAANAESKIGAAAWVLLGVVCAALNWWGRTGTVEILRESRRNGNSHGPSQE
jgi:hypothetical protein